MRHVADGLATLFDGSIVCGAEFDWLFLSRAMRRAGVAVPGALRLCTLRLSRSLDPERLRSHRLGDLCLRYDIPLIRPHDAADAEATAVLLPRLLAETGITERAQLEPYLEGTTTAWTRSVAPAVLSRNEPAPWPPPLPPPVGAPAVRAPLRSGRDAAAGAQPSHRQHRRLHHQVVGSVGVTLVTG